MTLKHFIKHSNLPARLINGVVKQIGGWQSFKNRANDVNRHGADGGYPGFIFNVDTCAFTKKHRAEIADLAEQMADDLGENLFEMIRGFRCVESDTPYKSIASALYGGKETDDSTQLENALAWFVLEEVCRDYIDLV